MSQSTEYRNITGTVRPARCAILINEKSSYWTAAVVGVVACAAEVWGGESFLIVPTDGTRIKEKFWELLVAYSPDHLAIYRNTFSDVEIVKPKVYLREKERFRTRWDMENLHGNFEDWFSESMKLSLMDEFMITEELNRELLSRLTPFYFQGPVVNHQLSRDSGFGFPFTQVSSILPLAPGHPDELISPPVVQDPVTALMLYSQAGLVSTPSREKLSEQQFPIRDLPDDYDVSELIVRLYGRRRAGSHLVGAYTGQGAVELAKMPFQFSMLKLGDHYRADTHLPYKEPVVVVLGDTVDDFCLYYSLSRLHENVYWMPLAWLRATFRAYMANIRRHERGEDLQELRIHERLVLTD